MIDKNDMQLYHQLLELLNATGKKNKQLVIQKYKDDHTFLDVLSFRLNPFDVIGISTKKLKLRNSFNGREKNISGDKPDKKFNQLNSLLKYLRVHHTGSNQDVLITIGYLIQIDDLDMQDFMATLITKKQSLGVGAKTVNQALGYDLIPDFNVQLAFPYQKKIDRYDDKDEFYVTHKFDGHRALTTIEYKKDKTIITVHSRQGKVIQGVKELTQGIFNFLQNNMSVLVDFPNGIALDGELLADNSEHLSTVDLFQKTSQILRSDNDKQSLRYNVFDILPLPEFLYHDKSTKDYQYRRLHWLDKLDSNKMIKIVPTLAKITKQEIPVWSHYATERGWEGVMINYNKGYYRMKRSPELLKVKMMHSADLPIVGFNQAIDGEFKGVLQSVNVKLDTGDVVQVGSGFSKELRHQIWEHQTEYLNRMIEIQYFEMTKNENGGKSLRFPVFKGFRDDKTPEDISIE